LGEDDAFYHAERIGVGIAHQGNDFPANDAFAHDIGLDILDGIDFAKGCYVGQEVVSRMKHRGTARRRPVIVSGIDAPAGSAVVAGGREAGTIGQVVDGMAVAILRLDRITDPAAVTVEGKPVGVALPVWATYQFGDAVAEE
jgi:folate-binding protein YgfZ